MINVRFWNVIAILFAFCAGNTLLEIDGPGSAWWFIVFVILSLWCLYEGGDEK